MEKKSVLMDQMKEQYSVVMDLNIVARMGIKDAKAGAYQHHGLMMMKKIVMMVQMKKQQHANHQSLIAKKLVAQIRMTRNVKAHVYQKIG